MSNQVYSAPLRRYKPSAYQNDKLTLTANNAAVPGTSPAYGNVIKKVNGAGTGVYWGVLNGVQSVTSGTVQLYGGQNPATIDMWAITADSTKLGGATLVWAKQDMDVFVNAVVPMDIDNKNGLTPNTLALAVRVYNADDSVDKTLAYNGFQDGIYTGGLSLTAPIPFSVSTMVSMRAGQYMSVVMISSTSAWSATGIDVDYKDFLAPQTTTPGFTSLVQMPCILELARM